MRCGSDGDTARFAGACTAGVGGAEGIVEAGLGRVTKAASEASELSEAVSCANCASRSPKSLLRRAAVLWPGGDEDGA